MHGASWKLEVQSMLSPGYGEPIVMSLVERDGATATINPNGVLIIKR